MKYCVHQTKCIAVWFNYYFNLLLCVTEPKNSQHGGPKETEKGDGEHQQQTCSGHEVRQILSWIQTDLKG